MKKLRVFLLALLVAFSTLFTACDFYDIIPDQDPELNPANNPTIVTQVNDNTESFVVTPDIDINDIFLEPPVSEDEIAPKEETQPEEVVEVETTIDENGTYTSKEDVALYIHTYNHLPSNFITKNKAKELGWDSSKGNLGKVAPGMSIGGDKFGNREGLLPKKDGRQYYECDIDSDGSFRNAKRIIFSNDGLIYYTEDHYESFELLYE
ncbi:MAG: ribonuclease [Lachnospiraceae bacterium]|nr:ribonuclease [Lachnospiraceae bacterium]